MAAGTTAAAAAASAARPPPAACLARPRPCAPHRALLESFRRADIKAQASFKNHELDAATSQTLFDSVADGLNAGTLKIHTTVKDGAKHVGGWFK